MVSKLRGIHTPDVSDIIGKIVEIMCAQVIFQNEGSFFDSVKKEMDDGTAGKNVNKLG